MQKKSLFGSLILIIGIALVWHYAAAAQTWTGPEAGCYDPSQTGCNADGVVWSRPDFNTAEVQIGNYKLSGSAEIGNDFIIGNDLYFKSSSKALRVDTLNSESTLYIGNYANPLISRYPVNVNINGDLTVASVANNLHPKITGYSVEGTNNLCINGDCRTSWPAGGGGGGDVTDVLFSAPITVSNSAGPQPNVGLIACGAGQIYKMSAGVWTCSADANSGGSITSISSADGSITVTNGAGPATGLTLNTAFADGRYVNVSGDTMSGNLNLLGGLDAQAGSRLGWSSSYGDWLMNIQPAANATYINGATYFTGPISSSNNITVTGAGQVKASTLCIGNDCRAAWPVGGGSGDITDVFQGTGVTVSNSAGPQPTISLNGSYQLPQGCGAWQKAVWNGAAWSCQNDFVNSNVLASVGLAASYVGGNVNVMMQTCPVGQVLKSTGGNYSCQADNNSGGTITGVTAGTGITGGGASGSVTMSLNTTYTDGRYLEQSSSAWCTPITVPLNGNAACTTGRYVQGVTTNSTGRVITINCCPLLQ